MTNAEKFRTAEERRIAYEDYCKECEKEDKALLHEFTWLELEYKEELKPCPLCGHTDVRVLKNSAGDVWYISCNGCGCRTGGNVVKDMAFEAWNRRVS